MPIVKFSAGDIRKSLWTRWEERKERNPKTCSHRESYTIPQDGDSRWVLEVPEGGTGLCDWKETPYSEGPRTLPVQ